MTETEFIFAVIGAVATIFGAIWAIFTFFLPSFPEYRNKKILEKEFGSGVYDKATIERSTRYYIRPKCSNIDPAQEVEPRHALMATSEDLFAKVDYFLQEDTSHRHLLILADSGMGKTSFALNYYAYNRQLSWLKRKKIALVPLGSRNSDRLITEVSSPTDTVIILDAFDEDTRAIKDHRARIRTLMELCEKFSKVIVTCRTQFFPRDEEIPVETGVLRVSPTAAGEKKGYEFWKLYLSPFDDKDVRRYIHKRYPFWHFAERKKAKQLAQKIPLLSIRPMLLAHIPYLIKSEMKIENASQLYEAMINAWLDRESYWIDKAILREYSELLAVDIFRRREERGTEQVTPKELSELSAKWRMDIENWKLTGRSLLNRDAAGNYKFAHRSIMEYLFVKRLLDGDKNCHQIFLTDQMKVFLSEMVGISLPPIVLDNNLEVVEEEEINTTAKLWNRLFFINEKDLQGRIYNKAGIGNIDDKSEYIFDDVLSRICFLIRQDDILWRKNILSKKDVLIKAIHDVYNRLSESKAVDYLRVERKIIKQIGFELSNLNEPEINVVLDLYLKHNKSLYFLPEALMGLLATAEMDPLEREGLMQLSIVSEGDGLTRRRQSYYSLRKINELSRIKSFKILPASQAFDHFVFVPTHEYFSEFF